MVDSGQNRTTLFRLDFLRQNLPFKEPRILARFLLRAKSARFSRRGNVGIDFAKNFHKICLNLTADQSNLAKSDIVCPTFSIFSNSALNFTKFCADSVFAPKLSLVWGAVRGNLKTFRPREVKEGERVR